MLIPTGILCRFIPGLTTSDLPVCLAAVEESASRLHEIQDYAYADDYDDDYYIGTFVDGGNDSEFEPSHLPAGGRIVDCLHLHFHCTTPNPKSSVHANMGPKPRPS
jgi:hypothetical protein